MAPTDEDYVPPGPVSAGKGKAPLTRNKKRAHDAPDDRSIKFIKALSGNVEKRVQASREVWQQSVARKEQVQAEFEAAQKQYQTKKTLLTRQTEATRHALAAIEEKHGGIVTEFSKFFMALEYADQKKIRAMLLKVSNQGKAREELTAASDQLENLQEPVQAAEVVCTRNKERHDLDLSEAETLKDIMGAVDRDKKGRFGECVTCMDKPATHVVVGCGHICLCKDCTDTIMQGEYASQRCPYCRQEFHGVAPKEVFCPTAC